MLTEFLEDLALQQLSPRTVEQYRSNVRVYLAFLGALDPLKVGVDDLGRFLRYLTGERKANAKTICRYFSGLNSFFLFLEWKEKITRNPLPLFRQRYLSKVRREAKKDRSAQRRFLSVEEMSALAHSIMDVRDQAVVVLLAKTGVRRQELVSIDLEDIDWEKQSITLKPIFRKRTNGIVFFDDETARVLKRWLAIRKARGGDPTGPLFLGEHGRRLDDERVHEIVTRAAEAIGLHDPDGNLKDKTTPHCGRHWFTTWLRRAGMTREHVSWLRGDAPKGTMDIYLHIDPEEVRRSYRACIPQLGF